MHAITPSSDLERIIGKYDSGKPGPKLIFIGGLHGNEPAGIEALQHVFNALESNKPDIKGSILGLAGNPKALEQERRQIDVDLNRIWMEEESGEGSEFQDKKELIDTLSSELTSHLDDVIFFDLHTTSSDSDPFILMSDTFATCE